MASLLSSFSTASSSQVHQSALTAFCLPVGKPGIKRPQKMPIWQREKGNTFWHWANGGICSTLQCIDTLNTEQLLASKQRQLDTELLCQTLSALKKSDYNPVYWMRPSAQFLEENCDTALHFLGHLINWIFFQSGTFHLHLAIMPSYRHI